MLINDKKIGLDKPVYLIAEIGSNHNQDKSLALEMIHMAAESGADAVKFQSIRFDKLYQRNYEANDFREWFKQIELDEEWYFDLANQAKKTGIDFISSPTYVEAVDLLEELKVPAYKIASPQVYGNLEIVRRTAKTGKPLIMSLGYCEYNDINNAVKVAQEEGNNQIILLHCISKYPMNPEDANLRFIKTLQKMFPFSIGFSDHSLDSHIAIAAVAMGACVIEKHVTINRKMKGPDHNFAITFEEFQLMSKKIRDITIAQGNGLREKLLDDEYLHRQKVELKAFAKVYLEAGTQIDSSHIMWSRFSGEAVTYAKINSLIGRRISSNLSAGAPISWDLFDS